MKVLEIKKEIHGLSEEMLTNLGRLVAIDSQLGTPEEGKPFGAVKPLGRYFFVFCITPLFSDSLPASSASL